MSRAPFASFDELIDGTSQALSISNVGVEVLNDGKLRDGVIDSLIYTAVFGPDELRPVAIWVIRSAAVALGATRPTIHDLYIAGGRGGSANKTAPAINVRGLTYDVAHSVFNAAKANDNKIVLFEIARSEMSYTWQRPADYTASALAGAIKAGYTGPVFVQGDHFQAIAGLSEEVAWRDSEGEGSRDGCHRRWFLQYRHRRIDLRLIFRCQRWRHSRRSITSSPRTSPNTFDPLNPKGSRSLSEAR